MFRRLAITCALVGVTLGAAAQVAPTAHATSVSSHTTIATRIGHPNLMPNIDSISLYQNWAGTLTITGFQCLSADSSADNSKFYENNVTTLVYPNDGAVAGSSALFLYQLFGEPTYEFHGIGTCTFNTGEHPGHNSIETTTTNGDVFDACTQYGLLPPFVVDFGYQSENTAGLITLHCYYTIIF